MVTLRDYQEDAINAVRRSFVEGKSKPLLVLPTGGGKCLAKDTGVMMADGTIKKVQDIENGNMVMGGDGTPRIVTSTCTGREKMYSVTPNKGEPYTVNESHILSLTITGCKDSVKAGDGNIYKAGDIANISIKDYLASSKTFKHVAKGYRGCVGDYWKSKGLDIPPYILGVWLGDGSSRSPEICNNDFEVIREWKHYAYSINHKVTEINTDTTSGAYRISPLKSGGCKGGTNFLLNFLKNNNLIMNKHIPHNYKASSVEDRLKLLAGILDTDGHLNKNSYDIVLKQKELADDVAFIARSVGLACYISICNKTIKETGFSGQYYRLSISGNTNIIPCIVERKKAKKRKQVKNVLVTGISVECVGVDNYYGFTLAGKDRLFMLSDFTVTHNTVCFSYMAHNSSQRGNRVLILVHRQELIYQTSEKLSMFGVDHGIISPEFSQNDKPVQVAMVQTLSRKKRLDITQKPDIIIVDECHHTNASNYMKIIEWAGCKVVGVTATPCRLDGKGLGDIFDDICVGTTVSDLIDRGYLSKYRYFGLPVKKEALKGLKIRMGDYSRETATEMAKGVLGDIVGTWKKQAENQPTIVFCPSVKSAETIAEMFQCAGYNFKSLDGSMDREYRKSLIQGLADGSIAGITSCDVISEGTDIPVASCAVLVRKTKSTSLYLQQVGRVLRPVEGKTAVIIDMVQNYEDHGMPCDDRDWELHTTKKRVSDEKEPSFRQCEECYACTPTPATHCCECGEPFPVKERKELQFSESFELAEIDFKNRKYQKAFVNRFGEFCESVLGWKKRASYYVWKRWEMVGDVLNSSVESWVPAFEKEQGWQGDLLSFVNYNKKLYRSFEQWQSQRA